VLIKIRWWQGRSETLDDGIVKTYQQAISQIRTAMFPSLIKPEKVKPVHHLRDY
jgi:hypothetical protein